MYRVIQSCRGDNSTYTNIIYCGDLIFLDTQEEFRNSFGEKKNILSAHYTSYNYENTPQNPRELLRGYSDRCKIDIFLHIFRQYYVGIN